MRNKKTLTNLYGLNNLFTIDSKGYEEMELLGLYTKTLDLLKPRGTNKTPKKKKRK